MIKKLYYVLLKNLLLTLYNLFIRPNLDYGDIPYDQPKKQAGEYTVV